MSDPDVLLSQFSWRPHAPAPRCEWTQMPSRNRTLAPELIQLILADTIARGVKMWKWRVLRVVGSKRG